VPIGYRDTCSRQPERVSTAVYEGCIPLAILHHSRRRSFVRIRVPWRSHVEGVGLHLNNLSRKVLLGMIGMFQPFAIALFRYGFLVLLFSTVAFIVVSHLALGVDEHESARPVTIHEVVEQDTGRGEATAD